MTLQDGAFHAALINAAPSMHEAGLTVEHLVAMRKEPLLSRRIRNLIECSPEFRNTIAAVKPATNAD